MSIETRTQFVDTATGLPVELNSCACGNSVFYVTINNESFCSCCKMTNTEAFKNQSKKESNK